MINSGDDEFFSIKEKLDEFRRLAGSESAPVPFRVQLQMILDQLEEWFGVIGSIKEYAAVLTESVHEPLMILDRDGTVLEWNPAARLKIGYTPEEVMGSSWSSVLVSPSDKVKLDGELMRLQEQEQSHPATRTLDMRVITKSGSRLPVSLKLASFGRNEKWHAVAALEDKSDKELAQALLQRQPQNDPLTGLPDKEHFKSRIGEAISRARRSGEKVAVLFVGMDNFNDINNRFGHIAGDRLLEEIAKRLSKSLREVDTVSRFGGDEFTVVLENVKEEQGAVVAVGKIMDALAKPYHDDQMEQVVTASVGITFYPTDGDNADILIKNADIAMHRAKELGKNQCQIFTPSLNEKVKRRLDLELLLKKAISRNEFVVHYQPKVVIGSGWIIGMEALVRWVGPKGNLISPGEFIPLAEETGMIVPLGQLVLREACRQTKIWHELGYDHLVVSVNLAARQIDHDGMVDTVKSALEDAGLRPGSLCLEVTESTMMNNMEKALKTLNELRKMGAKISLDDFGTGYSSLGYLTMFPLDELKIDRSFVLNVPSGIDDSTITNTIISMANALNLNVIAEGVERNDQLDFLRESGCGEIQGFLFSPPLPADEFEKMIKAQGHKVKT